VKENTRLDDDYEIYEDNVDDFFMQSSRSYNKWCSNMEFNFDNIKSHIGS